MHRKKLSCEIILLYMLPSGLISHYGSELRLDALALCSVLNEWDVPHFRTAGCYAALGAMRKMAV
jgi:hypothetical protein